MFKVGEIVRVKGEKPDSINEFAIVKHVYGCGQIWIANLNSPFAGSLSNIVEPDFIEKIEEN
jgi:hypothetical protein